MKAGQGFLRGDIGALKEKTEDQKNREIAAGLLKIAEGIGGGRL